MKLMHLKENTERFAWRFFIHSVLIIIRTFPEPVLRLFSQISGNLAFLLSKKRRKLAIENLTSALMDEKSPRQIKRIAKQVFCEIVQDGVDAAIFFLKNADIKSVLLKNISVEGVAYLDDAMKGKKGVICVSAHFGNFMVMTLRLSLMGYPCNMIAKDRINLIVSEIWQDLRKKVGINWIPARPRIKAASQSLKWLRNGGILFLYADQHNKDGVYVNFFNRPACTVKGPAMFHLKTGAEILCSFIIRTGRKKYKIIITPPINVKKTGNREEDICLITQAYTKVIENFVRQYPEQWWWPHKRWKKDIPLFADPKYTR